MPVHWRSFLPNVTCPECQVTYKFDMIAKLSALISSYDVNYSYPYDFPLYPTTCWFEVYCPTNGCYHLAKHDFTKLRPILLLKFLSHLKIDLQTCRLGYIG